MKKNFTFLSKYLLALLVISGASKINAQSGLLLSTKIAADSDDAEERGLNAASNPGIMDLTSSDIELVEDGTDGNQFVGLRFATVNLPKNAIIDSAFIQFVVDETNTGATSITIKTEATDSSVTFTTINGDISSRTTSADSVNWNSIPAWNTAQVATLDQRTPDLSGLIATRISQSGWIQGNPITFIITGTGERTAEAYNVNRAEAAELMVYYSAPVSDTFAIVTRDDDAEQDVLSGAMSLGSSDLEFTTDGTTAQVIGLRYQNVNIPQGSQILSAYLQFQVDETNSTDTVNIAWSIELEDNATAFAATTNNIGGRDFDTDYQIWKKVPAWPTIGEAGSDQKSIDLGILLQKVIDRKGWVYGNSVVFGGIDPSVLNIPTYNANVGKRTAEAYPGGESKLIVTYIPSGEYIDGIFPIAKASSWKYDDSGLDLTATNWTALNFNDSSWAFGDAILGYNNSNESTALSFGSDANNKQITTYLRHTFNAEDVAQYDSLIFDVLRDDGVVVYLNGNEVFRQNMPSGVITSTTVATSIVGGADETSYFRSAIDNNLIEGRNVIAVELHQQAASSSDLSFDMEVRGKLPPLATSSYPIASGDDWNYLDDGVDLTTTNWKDLNYNDTAWAYGPSPLGYSNPSATTLSFGPDATDKYITYYFRKRFNIANLTALSDSLVLSVKRDDGALVYINGIEIIRSNMPTGTITYDTESSTIVDGIEESTFYATIVSKNIFVEGDNIIAVEVHQRDSSSSDLTFDFTIAEKPANRKSCTGVNDPHISCFTSLFPTAQGPSFFIPETHAFQVLIEQGDTYMNTNVRTTVPGNNDFTGYIAREGSSIDGFLGINHENTPGGVSILDLRYIDTTRLWTVDSTQAVDFYNNDLVTTTRNCSGGITPWGTYITSEETGNSGDANSDGYQDVGWQVEIDPVTRKVKEYGTIGKQEKLWALGRMNHENIAVANDSVTAYEGVDVGSGCLFKFIADSKMDLSSGKLYALQLDSGRASNGEPLSSTGKWILVPNTTQADRNNSNSLAISLGATTFNGIEDAEIGTVDGKIYFTAKGSNRVYRFSDDSETSISEFETFVGGQSYLINYGEGIVSEPWANGNDNLCFDDLGNLYVLQDGSRDHVWMVRPGHTQLSPQIDIFAKLPAGSEPCGMTFTPDYKFMFLSVQHPSGGNSSTVQTDASGYGADMAKSTTVVIARKEHLGNYSPTLAATNLSFTTASCDSIDFSFNTGNGNGHLVVAKEGVPVDAFPADGYTYNANTTLGSGDNLGNNNFVIYDGLDSTLTLKGLKQNTEYHISIFEYNQVPNKYYNAKIPALDSSFTDAVITGTVDGNLNPANSSTETYFVPNTTGSTYTWNAGEGTIVSGQGSNSIDVTWPATSGASDLTVVEISAAGCEGDTVKNTVIYTVTGLGSVDLNKFVQIAPNPSNGRTTLRLEGISEAFNITITDMLGKQVLGVNNIVNTYEIDLTNEKKGTYVLRLESQNSWTTKMLIVQ